VEQLGHEKAPVRLGALYSLDHLAQDNPQYRQTVVDVFCAYMRMPSTAPGSSLAAKRPRSGSAPCMPLTTSPRTIPSTVRPSLTCSAPTCACLTPLQLGTTRAQPTWNRGRLVRRVESQE